ncbi:MAG TPA: chemotaxis protein CheB [Chloroflexia bacterium]|nr:chemotaxis protein CheB [Chloroflexia bacterium]
MPGRDIGHDIIVVGASAGGVEALITLVRGLPADLPAAVFVVLHIPAQAESALPRILNRNGSLPAIHAKDHQEIELGHIYVAPPDQHLLVDNGYVRLGRGAKENMHRPAIDPLFRSAARSYGSRVVGVVLSGALDDGTSGLKAIKERGGVAVVQDPNDASYSGMPLSAIQHVAVDYVGPISDMPLLLERLANESASEGVVSVTDGIDKDHIDLEVEIAENDLSDEGVLDKIGTPSHYACPDCHGTLWQIHDGDLVRFRCRVGHAYTAESMITVHTESVENALYAALRALEESASLSRQLARNARQRGLESAAVGMDIKAAETEQQTTLVRGLLIRESPVNHAG